MASSRAVHPAGRLSTTSMNKVDAPLLLSRAVPSVLLIGALSTWLFHTLFFCDHPPVERNEFAALVMASAATFFNVLVIVYHLTTPPHPKFRLIRSRRLCLKTHVAAGCVEIATSCAALFNWKVLGLPAADVVKHTTYAWKAGIIHSLTGLYQTGLVFGCKLVMRPAYYWCGIMHLMSALATRDDLANPHRVLGQYLTLCIFTWCRVFIPLLGHINFGRRCVYSLSISLAGIVIFPHVLGPLGPLYFAVFITMTAFCWAWSADISFESAEWEDITSEKVRVQLFDRDAMNAWKGLAPDATAEESDAAALKAFKSMDNDGSGFLDRSEVMELLNRVKMHATVRHSIIESLDRLDEKVNFPTFLKVVWNLGEHRGHHQTNQLGKFFNKDLSKVIPRERARAVFDSIDLDGSGKLEVFELAELLTAWGCPSNEVVTYMKDFDHDGDGEITFDDEFFPFMQQIWQFGWDYVLVPKIQEAQSQKGLNTVIDFERFKEQQHACEHAASTEATEPKKAK